jgi:hypothetical protein
MSHDDGDALPTPEDADAAWPPGRLYLAVRRKIEDEWQRCESTGAGSGLRFVLVSEWSDEGSTRHPAGAVVRAWIRDGGGLRPIAAREYDQLHPQDAWERRPFVSLAFHVCVDARHVAFAVTGGGGRTYFGGGPCWIDPADPRLRPTDGLL